MTTRTITRLIPSVTLSEGAGVTVHRSIGSPGLKNLDPFLLLDHFGSDDPDDYIAGFPEHPHRGFVTLTYMLDGHMEHRDSMGNRGDLHAGGAQWMKAASGVIHSELPRQTAGRMRGFQLWVNLPASEKLADPAYQEFPSEQMTETRLGDAHLRVLAGRVGELRGNIADPHTDLHYFDVRLPAQGSVALPLPAGYCAFAFVFEGEAALAGQAVPSMHLAVLGDGDTVLLQAGADGARLILVAARPLGEAIVQYGPFVMNTRAEIEQAIADFKLGRLGTCRA